MFLSKADKKEILDHIKKHKGDFSSICPIINPTFVKCKIMNEKTDYFISQCCEEYFKPILSNKDFYILYDANDYTKNLDISDDSFTCIFIFPISTPKFNKEFLYSEISNKFIVKVWTGVHFLIKLEETPFKKKLGLE